ncbi:MAG: histidine kinase [Bacteroidota bacterium]
MSDPSFIHYLVLIIVCLVMAVAGLYLLGNFKTLFRKSIRNELLRQNIIAWLVIFCFILATAPLNRYFFQTLNKEGILMTIAAEAIAATVNTLFVFILMSSYMAGITGMVYILMTTIEAERSRKLQEKELELSRMNELKTKAELDALHSKVNPHFLYNALNSIADLSITDGKKARQMTIALADLFRYSINYSHNNYTSIDDEVAMTEVYLQIEKIRFEDQLNYSVRVDKEAGSYLVPRFILQPLVENAVKHGLKRTGQLTEIFLEIKKSDNGLVINIADNGPQFPHELNPGYGVKSVYDKLDLLFPGDYEIHFINYPEKKVSMLINKLIKNEPAV